MTWTSAANSIAPLPWFGAYTFVIKNGMGAVACGVAPQRVFLPEHLRLGVMVIGNRWAVTEYDEVRSHWRDLPHQSTRFYIGRAGSQAFIAADNGDLQASDTVPPAATIYYETALHEPQLKLVGCLGMAGDAIYDGAVYADASYVEPENDVYCIAPAARLYASDALNAVKPMRVPLPALRVNHQEPEPLPEVPPNWVRLRAGAPILRVAGPNKVHLRVRAPSLLTGNYSGMVSMRAPLPRSGGHIGRVPLAPFGEILLPALTPGNGASEAPEPLAPGVAKSVLLVRDRAVGGAGQAAAALSAAHAASAVGGAPFEALRSTLQASDAADGQPSRAAIIDSARALATADGAPAPGGLASFVGAADEARGWAQAVLTQALYLSDRAAASAPTEPLASAAEARDFAGAGGSTAPATLRSVARVSDAAVSQQIAPARAVSALRLRDAADAPPTAAQASAVVLTADSGALHLWTHWPMTALAQAADGTVIAVGPGGIALLGGDSDDGAPIAASIDMGAVELAGYDDDGRQRPQARRKRIESVWLSMQNDAPMAVTIAPLGERKYTYLTRPSRSGLEKLQRAAVGKGMTGRYWSAQIGNVEGADFEVVEMTADVAISDRRI